ncbi:transglutaminase family protein [Paenibacillus sp. L3-i20]|uniref:transglutaminase-like domain-containing protein n=1 Tax=Paenibacillus sp. L3-i20 TaxID=2905833 RepID=UPI001EDFAE4C|nr:transglutaminase-like domain-containing protein [Paenibacillus sp. L3-i20]GKU77019.1 hypothetical protein L3i20_v214160 [Paenibacillus sp. L3-i20]
MRSALIILFNVFLLFSSVSYVHATSSTSDSWIDTSKLLHGVITITYPTKPNVKTKIRIEKGKQFYMYNLTNDSTATTFPLQLGNGEYKVMILEHVSEKSYKIKKNVTIKLNLKDEKVVYLNSIQNVNWSSTDESIFLAKQLVKGKKSNLEKAKVVYDYIISNIDYDYKLAEEVTNDYLPDINRTFLAKKDICYGYAALYAAMLRSLGIPAKLVMGESDYVDVYHAWNEVFIDGEWVIIDTTVDAGNKSNIQKNNFIKESYKYQPVKIY